MKKGTPKNETLVGTDEAEVIDGLAGKDTIQGAGGGDTIYGGLGNDVLFGFRDYEDNNFDEQWLISFGDDTDYLYGGLGNDIYVLDSWIIGERGKVIIIESPNEGTDTIIGSASKSRPAFDMPANVENYVNDTRLTDNELPIYVEINGNQSNNLIQTSPANWNNLDRLTNAINETWNSFEKFFGGAGNDTLKSGAGDDILDGGEGNDQLMGGLDADTLIGGAGTDSMAGGKGRDTFSFEAGDNSVTQKFSDQIKDFKVSENDQINLAGLESINCHVRDFRVASFAAALTDANKDFKEGKNVSIQFVGNNALMFVDFNADSIPDGLVTLSGIRAGTCAFVDYAESGAMFSL